MSDDTAQVNHLVPADIKERAKENADHGELSEAVRDVYRMYASTGGAETLAQLEVRLRKVRRERESVEDRIEALQDELDELRTRETDIQEEIRQYEQETTKYERLVAEMVALVRDGKSVFPTHGKVKTAASVKGCSIEEVMTDLKDRTPDVPDGRFTEGTDDDPTDELSITTSDLLDDTK